MEMFGSQTALLASRLGSELPRPGVEVACFGAGKENQVISSQPSQGWWRNTLKEIVGSLWGIWLVRIYFVFEGWLLLKPDLGTSASRLLSQCQLNQTWKGRPLNKVMRTRRSLELSSFEFEEFSSIFWGVIANGCWPGMTERITCPSLCFCCLISMYWFTLHCKWTSKGKRAKTNEANEGMTLREEPQWLAEHPFRYCRLGIIWISNSKNTFSFCFFSFGYMLQKRKSVDERGCFL